MTIPKRHNFKWSINEINSLQREYELLELDPQQIAEKHRRTISSILFKLRQEGIIENSARNGWKLNKSASGSSWVQDLSSNEDKHDYSEDEDEEQTLSDSSSECSYEEDEEDEEDEISFRNHIYDSFNSTNSRVAKLEESLDEMKNMISHMFSKLKKNKVLRTYEL